MLKLIQTWFSNGNAEQFMTSGADIDAHDGYAARYFEGTGNLGKALIDHVLTCFLSLW